MRIKTVSFVAILFAVSSIFSMPLSVHAATYIYTYTFQNETKTEPYPTQAACEERKVAMIQNNGVNGSCAASTTTAAGFYCYQATEDTSNVKTTCFTADKQQQCEQERQANPKNLSGGCAYSATDTSGIKIISNSSSAPVCNGTTAANCYKFLAPLEAGTTKVPADLSGYFKTMFIIIISLASVIAVLMIVYGGITYMSTDAIYNKQEGKEIIIRTLWGIAIIIAAWLILYTINAKALDTKAIQNNLNNQAQNFPVANTGNPAGGLSNTTLKEDTVKSLKFNTPQGGGKGGNTDFGSVTYNAADAGYGGATGPGGSSNGGSSGGNGGYSTGGGTGVAGTNLPIDASGYTTVSSQPSEASHFIYVSASQGNDNNQGSENAPIQSLAKALTMVRNNSEDHILLKKGDRWTGSISLGKSGESSNDRLIIGSYGTGERPVIQVPVNKNGLIISGNVHNVAIVGIHFLGATQNSERGISMIGAAGARDILIEDCYIEGFQEGISLDANGRSNIVPNPIRNVVIRRSIIANNWPKTGAHSQGIYAAGTMGLVIEGNTIDHNGWREGGGRTVFNHNVYLQQNSLNTVVRNNIISRGSSHGLQLRGGGTMEGNLFIDNAYNAFIDQQGTVKDNVVIGSHDINGRTAPGGAGIEILSLRAHDVTIDRNLIVHKGSNFAFPTLGKGISLGGASFSCHPDQRPSDCVPPVTSSMNNISVTNNVIYDWPGEFSNNPGKPTSNVSVTNNSWNGRAQNYPHPDYTLGTYNASLGGSSNTEGFISGALLQSKDHWRPAYSANKANEYMRAAFGM